MEKAWHAVATEYEKAGISIAEVPPDEFLSRVKELIDAVPASEHRR
jgi:hypothetical protein